MPLLMCPNCHEGTKQINREGVQIDMCPACHGVWLDRGELQKLLDAAREDAMDAAVAPAQPAHQPAPPPPQYSQPHYPAPPAQGQHYPKQYRDDDDYYRHHGKYRKKSKIESIFDIFD